MAKRVLVKEARAAVGVVRQTRAASIGGLGVAGAGHAATAAALAVPAVPAAGVVAVCWVVGVSHGRACFCVGTVVVGRGRRGAAIDRMGVLTVLVLVVIGAVVVDGEVDAGGFSLRGVVEVVGRLGGRSGVDDGGCEEGAGEGEEGARELHSEGGTSWKE